MEFKKGGFQYRIPSQFRNWFLAVIGAIMLAEAGFAEAPSPSNPNSAKACAICHYRWIDTFFIEGKGTDLVDYHSAKAAATPEMCYSCHDGSVVDSRRKAYKNLMHRIDEPVPETVPIPSKFPLGPNNRMQCATCHTPHGVPSGAGTDDTIFMRTSNKNSAMCLSCHTEKVAIAGSKHNLNYSAVEEKNLESQTVAQGGPCSACHLQHAPARKLAGDGNVTSQICFSCHSEDNVAAKFRLVKHQHPFDVSHPKKEDNMILPLFDTLGSRKAGRVLTCATCHNPHQWDPNSDRGEIEKEKRGDRTNSFLRKPAPQICVECHRDKAMVEGTDHDLTVTALHSKNVLGHDPVRAGLCGVCHQVHNSENNLVLWAQGYGPGNNVMERMCNSCHSRQGAANHKIPSVYFHPREKIITKPSEQEFFPLYHAMTGKPVERGNISCPSCHNAHQWAPHVQAKGIGLNREGSLADSFLRPRDFFGFCAECHKQDAGVKFDYFHDPKKRKFKSFEEQFFQ